jgi:hypothetical protein
MQLAEVHTYEVNSKHRISGTDGDFSFVFDATILGLNSPETRVTLWKASIPLSWYNVQAGYNIVTVSSADLGSPAALIFPPGNYNRRQLGAMTVSLLNTAFGLTPATFAYTRSSVPGCDDGRYVFTVSGTPNQPSLTFTNGLYEELGFLANTTHTFVANNLVSVAVTSLQGEANLYVRSSICQSQNNILASISTGQSPTYGYVNYKVDNLLAFSVPFTFTASDIHTFALTNDDDDAINLNGVNWTMTLVVFKMVPPPALPNITPPPPPKVEAEDGPMKWDGEWRPKTPPPLTPAGNLGEEEKSAGNEDTEMAGT